MTLPKLNFIQLINTPIYQQLHLEEALLRGCNENYCIINQGSPKALILGVSSKKEEWINISRHNEHPLPIIRRFTGGGAVAIDEDTLFVTFICQEQSVGIAPFPEKILNWTSIIYQQIFPEEFSIQGNDYTLNEKKMGGNAQYLAKNRWVHHTSFLWNFSQKMMEYLLHPPKMPLYRKERSHQDFLTSISPYFKTPACFTEQLRKTLSQHFNISTKTLPLPAEKLTLRKGTKYL